MAAVRIDRHVSFAPPFFINTGGRVRRVNLRRYPAIRNDKASTHDQCTSFPTQREELEVAAPALRLRQNGPEIAAQHQMPRLAFTLSLSDEPESPQRRFSLVDVHGFGTVIPATIDMPPRFRRDEVRGRSKSQTGAHEES